jgi:hypothetical protein
MVLPLLRAEGGEKEPQVGFMALALEDGRPPEVEAMILLMRPSLSTLT